MGTRLVWWVLRANSFLGRPWAKVPVGPRIGVLGACGRALLPEIGAKHRCATHG